MTDTTVSDAELLQRDEGVGSIATDADRWHSAGTLGATAKAGRRAVVDSGLEFANHDGANDQVDVTAGRAVVLVSGVQFQSSTGGTTPPAFDTTLSGEVPVPIELPADVTNLALTAATLNDVWLAIDIDGTGPVGTAGEVYLRHGTGLDPPGQPFVKLGRVNPDDATADVLNNRIATTSAARTYTTADQDAQRQSVPVPQFTKLNANPILDGAGAAWTSNLNFPSFFVADGQFSAPLGDYYIYYSSHSTQGLGLLYSDEIDGSWTDQGRIVDDNNMLESDCVWDDDNDRLRVYANGPNASINYWISNNTDGTGFTLQGETFGANNHAGYPRVTRVGPEWYMGTFVNEGAESLRVLMHDENGTADTSASWRRLERHAGYRDRPTNTETSKQEWSAYSYLPYFDGWLVAWMDRSALEASSIRMGYTRDGLHIHDWGTQLTSSETWEDGFLKYPDLQYADGRIVCAYSAGANGSGDSTAIGLATAPEPEGAR